MHTETETYLLCWSLEGIVLFAIMCNGFYEHFKKPLNLFPMPERKNPITSVEAWRSITPTDLNDIYKKILDALGILEEGTFEEIATVAMVDKSKVWKRMSELERMELCYRPGKKKTLKSGRKGFTWKLTTPITKKPNPTTTVTKSPQIAMSFTE